MGAKRKLNAAYVAGSLLAAAVVGGLTGSGWAFIVTAIVLVALNVHSGDIRP